MPQDVPEELSRTIETLYRSESGRILATLARLLGDLDVAEEAMHEAFAAALDTWPKTGIPDKPRPWLISTARFKAIDGMRRRARFDSAQKDLEIYTRAHANDARVGEAPHEEEEIEDDRLRLIFTRCHPALPPEGQVALTLREVCGLTTERCAGISGDTAQRLRSASCAQRQRFERHRFPTRCRHPQELPSGWTRCSGHISRFNEGYSAAAGTEVTRAELTGEAIRSGRLLIEAPARAESPRDGDSGAACPDVAPGIRRAARPLQPESSIAENQDRSLWNRSHIEEGLALSGESAGSRRFGAYTLQAAIAAVHAEAESTARDRLAADRCAVRPVGTNSAFAGVLSKSLRGHCHARWSGGRSSAYRRGVGTGRIGELLPGACSPRGYVPQAGQDG